MTKKGVQMSVMVALSLLVLVSLIGLASSTFMNIKINEFVSNPVSGSDWVEIYYGNGGSGVDLGNCVLRDLENNELQLGGIINSGEFISFDWSSRLGNDGDIISFVCYGDIVDRVIIGMDQVAYGGEGNVPVPPLSKSAGRCDDGYDTDSVSDFVIMNPTKGTANSCNSLSCGDGQVDEGEQCDSGEANGVVCNAEYESSCSYCTSECLLENYSGGVCGDHIVNGREQCDDGNTRAGDGCSKSCREESTGGDGGTGIGVDIETEEFAPLVWMCDNRLVYDDATEPGRISEDGNFLLERMNNYAFEGEQVQWEVLVMDKNKIDQNIDVYATIGDVQGEGNDIEVNCARRGYQQRLFESCNAKILEEEIEWNPDTMDFFTCTLTVETPESMYGEYWITVEALDGEGLMGTMDENEYWFLNPEIALGIDGELVFENVRPGAAAYSETMLISNEADDGSGVRLDMFISGTDFYDSSSAGTRCPVSNQLELENFRYFTTHGAYSSQSDPRSGSDVEGYLPIEYGIGFNDPRPFYDRNEILQSGPMNGPYYQPNILSPGAEFAITFRLNLPEPCVGDFDTGSIYFWGEAI